MVKEEKALRTPDAELVANLDRGDQSEQMNQDVLGIGVMAEMVKGQGVSSMTRGTDQYLGTVKTDETGGVNRVETHREGPKDSCLKGELEICLDCSYHCHPHNHKCKLQMP